jgi:hypothetical protein
MSVDGDGCGDDEIHSAGKCANCTSQKKAELNGFTRAAFFFDKGFANT